MTTLVVDASVAAAIEIVAQRTDAVMKLIATWDEYEPVAPFVFNLETPWLLLKRERRYALGGFARRALGNLSRLLIDVYPAPDAGALSLAFDVAERNGLGLYDAHYLLLALETGGVLATKDSGLIRAAGVFGIDVLDVR